MRLSGNFYCQCLPPSVGSQCEIGLVYLFLFSIFFSFANNKVWKKNKKNKK